MDYDAHVEESCVDKAVLGWGRRVREVLKTSGIRRVMSTRTLVRIAKLGDASKRRFFSGWKEDELAKIPRELRT
jgi:hypothetical protein